MYWLIDFLYWTGIVSCFSIVYRSDNPWIWFPTAIIAWFIFDRYGAMRAKRGY